MKKIFCFSIVLLSVLTTKAQCYQPFMDAGMEAFDASDFKNAINQFEAAAICGDQPPNPKADEWIKKSQKEYINAIQEAKKDTEALQFFSLGQEQECKGFFKVAFDHYSDAVSIREMIIPYRERRLDLALNEEIAAYEIAIVDLEFLIKNGEEDKKSSYLESLASVKELQGDVSGALIALNSATSQSVDVRQQEVYDTKLKFLKVKNGDIVVVGRDSATSSSGTSSNLQIGQESRVILKGDKAFRNCIYDNIELRIGDKVLKPIQNQISLEDLKMGTYEYTIEGDIQCGNSRQWPVKGKRTITIRPSKVYYLRWKLNKYGACEAWLSNF